MLGGLIRSTGSWPLEDACAAYAEELEAMFSDLSSHEMRAQGLDLVKYMNYRSARDHIRKACEDLSRLRDALREEGSSSPGQVTNSEVDGA